MNELDLKNLLIHRNRYDFSKVKQKQRIERAQKLITEIKLLRSLISKDVNIDTIRSILFDKCEEFKSM